MPAQETSLVDLWLRVCLPSQGYGFDSWSRRSHMLWSAGPMHQQPLKPKLSRARVFHTERLHCGS